MSMPARNGVGISHQGFNKVVNLAQDVRYKDKQRKLKHNLIVHANVKNLKKKAVDMKKIKMETVTPWITKKLKALLGFDDEIVLDYLINQLEEKQYPDPKEVQINITGFINGKNAKEFVGELWPMLVSATENGTGIPQSILDAKKREIQSRHGAKEEYIDSTNVQSTSKLPDNFDSTKNSLYNKLQTKKAPKTETIELLDDSDDDEVVTASAGPEPAPKSQAAAKREPEKACFIEDDDEIAEIVPAKKPKLDRGKTDKHDDDICEVIDDDEDIQFVSSDKPLENDQNKDKQEKNLPDPIKDLLAYTEAVNDPTLNDENEVVEEPQINEGKDDEVTVESNNPDDIKEKASAEQDKLIEKLRKDAMASSKDSKSPVSDLKESKRSRTERDRSGSRERSRERRHKHDKKSKKHRRHRDRSPSRKSKKSKRKRSRYSSSSSD